MAASAVLVMTHGDATIVLGRVACPADLGVVDALARLQLVAKRLGCRVVLREITDDLGAMLWLAGVADLFGELGRQPEGGEQVGVQEVVDRRDPPG